VLKSDNERLAKEATDYANSLGATRAMAAELESELETTKFSLKATQAAAENARDDFYKATDEITILRAQLDECKARQRRRDVQTKMYSRHWARLAEESDEEAL